MGQDLECPACASRSITLSAGSLAGFIAHRIGPHPVHTCDCRDCGLHYSSLRITDEQAKRIYHDYRGPQYTADRERYEPGYAARYGHLNEPRSYMGHVEAFITSHLTPGELRILDYGGNDGQNTPLAAQGAVHVHEVGDPHPDGPFDLIVLAHVLEHVPWPRQTIGTLIPLLAPGGVIYAEVPLEPPVTTWHEHINQFTPKALAAVFHDRLREIAELATPEGSVLMAVYR